MLREELKQRLTPEHLIRRFANMVANRGKWRGQPLWYLVSEITGHGSTYSVEICSGLGFDPHHKLGEPLQPPASAQDATPGERNG